MSTKIDIAEIDADSASWRTVKRWAEAEIEATRDDLEASETRAEFHRGRLSALRDLLDLPKKSQAVVAATPTYLE